MSDPVSCAVAITGASGALYGVTLVRALARLGHTVHVVVSEGGARVLRHECDLAVSSKSPDAALLAPDHADRVVTHAAANYGASIASGSFPLAGMAVCPCSMGTLGRIAAGTGENLVTRAADVCLKEGRPLVLVPRETPFSLIHLENMARLTRAGATVLPANPGVLPAPAAGRGSRRLRRGARPRPVRPRARSAGTLAGMTRLAFLHQVRETAEMVKISHTIFGLPFALGAAALAMRAEEALSWTQLGWIVFCAVMARTAAMAQNRWADARIDQANPRTQERALPAGRVSSGFVLGLVLVTSALFVVGAGMLNRTCLVLSPVVLVVVLGYPYAKRFTALCHLWLGVALGLAPVGAWVAVRGGFAGWPVPVLFGAAVMLWTAGFDCIYACQDADYDRREGLFSVPARFGVPFALRLARVVHAVSIALLIAAGILSPDLGFLYFAAVVFAAALLAYENALVRPDDLSRINLAFFTLNGIVSLVVGGAIVVSAAVPSG